MEPFRTPTKKPSSRQSASQSSKSPVVDKNSEVKQLTKLFNTISIAVNKQRTKEAHIRLYDTDTNDVAYAKHFAMGLYLVKKQVIEVWKHENVIDELLDEDYLNEIHAHVITFQFGLDLDYNTDSLLIHFVSIVLLDNDRDVIRRLDWTSESLEEDSETLPHAIIDQNITSFVDTPRNYVGKLPYQLPNVSADLKSRSKPQYRVLHNAYTIENETPKLDDNQIVDISKYYNYLDRLFINVWLRLHDKEYLEQKYGLVILKAIPKLPKLLLDDESFITALAETHEASIYVFATDTYSTTPSIWNVGIQEVGKDEYMLEKYQLGHTPTQVIKSYVEFKADGRYIFAQMQIQYQSREEAARAIFRLRQQVLAHPEIRAEAARIGKQQVGAVPGALAAVLPRATAFGIEKPPQSYTRTEAETKWRLICKEGRPEEATDVDELNKIVDALGVETKAKSVIGLCRAISKQYEVEFGERARLREFGEVEVPTSTKSPVTLEPPPSPQITRRSPSSRTKSPRSSPRRSK